MVSDLFFFFRFFHSSRIRWCVLGQLCWILLVYVEVLGVFSQTIGGGFSRKKSLLSIVTLGDLGTC